MIKDVFVVAFIADIHFGALKSETLYNELQERFLKEIDMRRIDMLVFGGDLFHNIITMNYSTSHYVLLFMEKVIDLCKRNNIKYIRILQGTMSHDNNQLNNFHIFENKTDVDFKIILTVQKEILAEGIKILYVPEEYITDMDSYYSEYLNERTEKYYDFIFGHGMFKEVAFIAKNQESEVTMSKAPIFDSKWMMSMCKGPIYFGHIHTRTSIKHIHYPGSFSRFRHGEEDPKGFYIIAYNTSNGKYAHEFIENNLAQEYVTITAIIDDENRSSLEPSTTSAIIDEALKQHDFIKFKLVINSNADTSYLLTYLNEKYSKSPRVKIDVKNNFEFKQEQLVDQTVQKIYDKYDFVFDKGLKHEEKIQKFIKVKNEKEVPIDIIKEMLNII